MTRNDGFGRTVSNWLDEEAQGGAPTYLDEVLVQTARIRQRPAWSSLERWLPVQATLRIAPVPTVWFLVVLALILAFGAAVLVAGSQPRLPEPFGLARNGSIAYGAPDGDIHIIDPVRGVSSAVIAGPTIDLAPTFSRDGSRLIFARQADVAGRHLIVLAKADGSGSRRLTEPLTNLTWFAWSPDGTRVAVVSDLQDGPALWVLDIDQMTTRVLSRGMEAEAVQWRPDGRDLVFRGLRPGPGPATYGLYLIGADGAGLRPIVPPTDSAAGDWQSPALSPDGTRIIYTQWDEVGGRLWVVGVDGGRVQKLAFDGPLSSDYYARWSPDGKQIVFHRWSGETFHLAVAPAGGGHAVQLGPGMLQAQGAASAEFSPDGTNVIARYPDGSTRILGVTDGSEERLPSSEFLATWQRLAR